MKDCIHMVGVWETLSHTGWKCTFGLEDTLLEIQRGEEILFVEDVNEEDVKRIGEELQGNTNLLWLILGGGSIFVFLCGSSIYMYLVSMPSIL